jgi:hypothetical protein
MKKLTIPDDTTPEQLLFLLLENVDQTTVALMVEKYRNIRTKKDRESLEKENTIREFVAWCKKTLRPATKIKKHVVNINVVCYIETNICQTVTYDPQKVQSALDRIMRHEVRKAIRLTQDLRVKCFDEGLRRGLSDIEANEAISSAWWDGAMI